MLQELIVGLWPWVIRFAARKIIVQGAVSMVSDALEQLNGQGVVALDEERKAAMVSNLLVVLCGDQQAKPVINTGSFYQ